ncbi:RHS repeat protein, partial [Microbulbifer halophilus]|nr:RHS repeat protein [Microbulbifer halophilus]
MYLDVENRQGVRYRVREGWHYRPLLPQRYAEGSVDLPLLLSFDDDTVERIFGHFLLFGQQLPDPGSVRGCGQHRNCVDNPYAGVPPHLSDERKSVYLALAEQRLIIEENLSGDNELAEQQLSLSAQIRRGLQQIIAEERAEAARIQREHEQRNFLEKQFAHAARRAKGFGQAAWGLVVWVKDAAEVSAAISPARQAFAAINATVDYVYHDKPLEESASEHLANIKGEVVDVLGFDPTSITREQLRQAFEIAELIYDDPALRTAITQFVRDYVEAQHSLEMSEFIGAGIFEVVLTIVLAAFTGGVGAAAALGKNARLLGRFRRIGELMVRFARLKKQRLRLSRNRGA